MSAYTKRGSERDKSRIELEAEANEKVFFDLRRAGASSTEAGMRLGLTVGQVERLRGLYAAESGSALSTDSSCPKFAEHGGHVEAVINCGGFVRLSEKPARNGQLIACLPIIPFEARP